MFRLIPSSAAISRPFAPRARRVSTSRSRGVRWAPRSSAASCSAAWRLAGLSRCGMMSCPSRTACTEFTNWAIGVCLVRYPRNPIRSASSATWLSSRAVSARVLASGHSFKIRLPASSPLWFERATSIRTRSGRVRNTLVTASSAVSDTPATITPAASRADLMASANNVCSSTIRTRRKTLRLGTALSVAPPSAGPLHVPSTVSAV